MALTQAQSAAVALGILIPFFAVTACVFIWLRRRKVASLSKSAANDLEAQVDHHDAPLASEDYSTGTTRRATGKRQTFSDWIQSNHSEEIGKHERYPSLEHGPGPAISSVVSSTYSKALPSPATESSPSVLRPVTRDSVGGSSFRRAVLEAASDCESEHVPEVPVKNIITEAKEPKESRKKVPRGYSGAWP